MQQCIFLPYSKQQIQSHTAVNLLQSWLQSFVSRVRKEKLFKKDVILNITSQVNGESFHC